MAEKVTITKADVASINAHDVVGEGDRLDLKKLTKEELIERESQVSRRCRGPLKEGAREKINELMAKGTAEDTEAAKNLDAASRKRCGYDMNEVFLKGPLDGEDHEYTCPNCGVKGTYRAAGPVPG